MFLYVVTYTRVCAAEAFPVCPQQLTIWRHGYSNTRQRITVATAMGKGQSSGQTIQDGGWPYNAASQWRWGMFFLEITSEISCNKKKKSWSISKRWEEAVGHIGTIYANYVQYSIVQLSDTLLFSKHRSEDFYENYLHRARFVKYLHWLGF